MKRIILSAAAAAFWVGQASATSISVYDNFADTGTDITFAGSPSATGTANFSGSSFLYDWSLPGTVGGKSPADSFAADFSGSFTVGSSGPHVLTLGSDDASYLYVDGVQQIARPGPNSYDTTSATLDLGAGSHTFEIKYDNVICCGAAVSLDVGDGAITAAVPEPSTWAMMMLGFCGMGFIAYRRRDWPALNIA